MAKLVIKGHTSRGKEVIKILKMLGGAVRVPNQFAGHLKLYGYYINSCGFIEFKHISGFDCDNDIIIYSLEEFLEEFPYKVGDKVINTTTGDIVKIVGLVWQENTILYNYHVTDINYYGVTTVNKLLPYKEAPMYLNGKANKQSDDIKKTIEPVKEIMEEKDTMGHTSELKLNHPVFKGSNEIEIIIPDGWEFKRKDNKMFGVRKQPQYPKTYEECCKIMGINPNYEICIHEQNTDGKLSNIEYSQNMLKILDSFKKLLVCRDAYWKIAGEEMGLDKPWEPNYSDDSLKYCIYFYEKHVSVNSTITNYHILVFPSEKITKSFSENFIYLIKECWHLLK